MNFDVFIVSTIVVVGVSFFIIPFLPSQNKSVAAFFLVAINAVLTSYPAIYSIINNDLDIVLNGGFIFGDIHLRIDALSAWFILIVNITAFNGALYGIGYMKPTESQRANTSLHWVLFVLFHMSMVWVCMLQHTFAFLISWEIMSVSSLLLVLFDHTNPKTIKAGLNYLVQMHIGVALISVAFIWLYFSQGSFDFISYDSFFMQKSGKWMFLLLFLGFGLKAGFIPLHTWLPHAHSAAPSHISGVMSGVIVKMGIYGILRMVSFLRNDLILIGEIILVLSLLTSFYGILNAAIHRDFKRMLAYCTIENVGIIGIGIGLGMIGKGMDNKSMMFIGFSGALLHTLNHALYKSLLFFASGNVYLKTHTRNMEQLGGVIKSMPVTGFFYLAGALAISGLPPFNGFISEFLIYSGLIDGIKSDNIQFSSLMIISVSVLALVGGLSLFTFTKSFGTIFLGSPREKLHHPLVEVDNFMHIPLFIILFLMIFIGVFPNLVLVPVTEIIKVFDTSFIIDDQVFATAKLLSKVGIASLGMYILAMAVYFVKLKFTKEQAVAVAPTWGCGYVAPNIRMQYSSKSYSRSLVKLFSFVIVEKKSYQEIEKESIFPKNRNFQSYVLDYFEVRIINKAINIILRFTDYFTFIHNGKIQLYLLYGVFFIIMLLIASFLNLI